MSDFERELEAYLDERLALTGSAKHTWITEGARWALESQVVRAMAEALKERDQLRAERDQYKIDMEIADAQAGELRAEVAAAWAEVERLNVAWAEDAKILKDYEAEIDRLRAALERVESEDNGWAGFEAAKALAKGECE